LWVAKAKISGRYRREVFIRRRQLARGEEAFTGRRAIGYDTGHEAEVFYLGWLSGLIKLKVASKVAWEKLGRTTQMI